jgi:ATP-dependent DNA helicase 2 subunit 1
MPPGLWLIPLPFADDIRQAPELPDEQRAIKTTDELTDRMRIVIEQLQLPKGVYDPGKYPNPDLQWFYRILQAMALEDELPEKPDDKTIPKYKQINKRCAGYIEDFAKEFDVTLKTLTSGRRAKAGAVPAAAPKKRGVQATRIVPDEDDDEALPVRKKVKTEGKSQDAGAMTDQEMADLNDRGQISKMLVPALKEFLSKRRLPTGGKKADLVERVQEYLERKGL